jgi:hypothetical protein
MQEKITGSWGNLVTVNGYSYTCGYCGSNAGPSKGYQCVYSSSRAGDSSVKFAEILICPTCNKPTFINTLNKQQVPGPRVGDDIEYLPDDIQQLYNEARNCVSVNAYTSSVLSCRKLLMNVSVTKGAEAGKRFAFYVDYLYENHFIPPNSKEWVDHIRQKGNEATHEINQMTESDAVELLEFTAMLLRFVYELPGKMTKYKN